MFSFPPVAPAETHELPRLIEDLYSSGKYSDMIIKCQDRQWNVHRTVVCLQSKPLAAAVDGYFKEATTGEIDLEEDEPEIVGLMLQFLYKGTYPDGRTGSKVSGNSTASDETNVKNTVQQSMFSRPSFDFSATRSPVFSYPSASATPAVPPNAPFGPYNGGSTSSIFRPILGAEAATPDLSYPAPVDSTINPTALITNARVYVIAEQYDIEPLKVLARTKYAEIVPSTWNSTQFVQSLKFIYDGTPDNISMKDKLREVAMNTAGQHARELMEKEEFLALCKERGDIATDVLKASLNRKAQNPVFGGKLRARQCKIDANHDLEFVPSRGNGGRTSKYRCSICQTYV